MASLTKKQQTFVDEYLVDLNATQAAIRTGYSSKTANRIATELLSKPVIQAEIEESVKKRSARTEITQDRVLLEIARLAFNDPRKVFDKNNALLPIHEWPDDVAAAISSIKVLEYKVDGEVVGETKEVKFWDKGKQLELAGKHLRMLTEKIEHTGKNGGPIQTSDITKDQLLSELEKRGLPSQIFDQ